MKKFVLMFAMLIAFVCASAQNPPIEQGKVFDETYIGVNIGTSGEAHSGDWTGMNAGLRFGKWFTPRVGVELEGTAQFNDFYRTIHDHRVGINALVNLNYLTGYKGYRHDCEFVPFVGIGWQRNYHEFVYTYNNINHYRNANYMYTKMGLQVNVNLKHGWQFNIIPQVGYILNKKRELQYDVRNMDYGIALGVTYNFKNSHDTHWFTVCDKRYTQSEFDAMNDRINCLLADINGLELANSILKGELEECANNPVEVEAVVHSIPVYVLPNVQFLFNSAQISDTSIATLYEVAELMIENPETKWTITGYASNEGTEQYNLELSHQRAAAVYNWLVNYDVDPNQLTVVAGGITEEYPEPCLNRIVTFTPQ